MTNEEWRRIPEFPYEASSLGRIRRIGSGCVLTPHVWRTGYLSIGLWRGGIGYTKKVHRLVCEAFHGSPPPHSDAAHANGNKQDNRPENLRWATRKENEADKKLFGRDNAGSRNGMAILVERDVLEILSRIPTLPRSSGGKRIKKGALPQLAAEYGVTHSALRNIMHGTRWRHMTDGGARPW